MFSNFCEELPGFHPVISVLHRPLSTKQKTRTRSSQRDWEERTNHRAWYMRLLSISGKRNNTFFPVFYTHFYKNRRRRNSIWPKNCKSRNKLTNKQTHLVKGFVVVSFSGRSGTRYHYLKPHPVVRQGLGAIVWFLSFDGRSGTRYRSLKPHLVVSQGLVTIIWFSFSDRSGTRCHYLRPRTFLNKESCV